jgi:hypothetical protein
MIIKNLTTIGKCKSKLLQTCTIKNVPKEIKHILAKK